MLTYYIIENGETVADAEELRLPYSWQQLSDDPKHFAEQAADYCHARRDGWEWHWPKTFVVLRDGAEAGRFSVNREMVPEFSATKLNNVLNGPA